MYSYFICFQIISRISGGVRGGQWNISNFPKEDLYWGCGGGNISKFPEEDLYLDSLYTVQPVLSKHLRDNQNLLA